jgi:hypothetical protein
MTRLDRQEEEERGGRLGRNEVGARTLGISKGRLRGLMGVGSKAPKGAMINVIPPSHEKSGLKICWGSTYTVTSDSTQVSDFGIKRIKTISVLGPFNSSPRRPFGPSRSLSLPGRHPRAYLPCQQLQSMHKPLGHPCLPSCPTPSS